MSVSEGFSPGSIAVVSCFSTDSWALSVEGLVSRSWKPVDLMGCLWIYDPHIHWDDLFFRCDERLTLKMRDLHTSHTLDGSRTRFWTDLFWNFGPYRGCLDGNKIGGSRKHNKTIKIDSFRGPQRRTKTVTEGLQRVFLRHTVYHHETSEGEFEVRDQVVRAVQGSAEVLHFQMCDPLRKQYNGGCVDHTFDIQMQVDK